MTPTEGKPSSRNETIGSGIAAFFLTDLENRGHFDPIAEAAVEDHQSVLGQRLHFPKRKIRSHQLAIFP